MKSKFKKFKKYMIWKWIKPDCANYVETVDTKKEAKKRVTELNKDCDKSCYNKQYYWETVKHHKYIVINVN